MIRFGVLGAARIAPAAIVRPARAVESVSVLAVAARDPERAQRFAKKHQIPRVHATYDDVLGDPEIDAIYNPLPNGLHAEWTIRALDAEKHILCEKPFTANSEEAERVAARASASDRVVMEAFHYRYHPVAERMREIAQSGELGAIQRIDTTMCIPLPLPNDIRYRYDLGGGALMDVGCYAIHWQRLLSGEEPEVTGARVRLASPDVDRWAQADLVYPNGVVGTMTCALWSSALLRMNAKVVGERGTLNVFNPTGPQFAYRMTVRTPEGRRRVRVEGARTPTYTYQLQAFASAVEHDGPVLTPPSDSVANMAVIDAVYDRAGLRRRGL